MNLTKLETFVLEAIKGGGTTGDIAVQLNRTTTAVNAAYDRALRKQRNAQIARAREVNGVIESRNLYVNLGGARVRVVDAQVVEGSVQVRELYSRAPVTVDASYEWFTGSGHPVTFSWFPSKVPAALPTLPAVKPVTTKLMLPPAPPSRSAVAKAEAKSALELLQGAIAHLGTTEQGKFVCDAVRFAELTPTQWDALAIVVTEYKHA